MCVVALGARRRAREGSGYPHLETFVKCFCALVVTAKRRVDELFMHYFRNSDVYVCY